MENYMEIFLSLSSSGWKQKDEENYKKNWKNFLNRICKIFRQTHGAQMFVAIVNNNCNRLLKKNQKKKNKKKPIENEILFSIFKTMIVKYLYIHTHTHAVYKCHPRNKKKKKFFKMVFQLIIFRS